MTNLIFCEKYAKNGELGGGWNDKLGGGSNERWFKDEELSGRLRWRIMWRVKWRTEFS